MELVHFTDIITTENVKLMGEMMALCAFKPFLKHSDPVFGRHYKGLIKDIHRTSESNYNFSDGYDFAQTAICFLCGHMGRTLNDVIGVDRYGKALTVKRACFRAITRDMNKMLSNADRNVCIDKVYEMKTSTRFEPDITTEEEDFTGVNETIEKLKLTEKQKAALLCMMDVNSYAATGRILSSSKALVWQAINGVRKKYIRVFSEPKWRVYGGLSG